VEEECVLLQRCRDGCGCECCAGGIEIKGARMSYMILKARSGDVWETAISLLSVQSLEAVEGELLPTLSLLTRSSRGCAPLEIVECFERLNAGAFSSGEQCVCVGAVVCMACVDVSLVERKFVWAEFFARVYPLDGGAPWFGGVTCGAGDSTVGGRQWLSCPLWR
jgi:hypothetical protein